MEVPDDIFQHDINSMPAGDPGVQAKLQAELDKARKNADAAEQKKRGRPPAAKSAPSTNATYGPSAAALAARTRKLQKIRLYFMHLGHKLRTKEPATMPKEDVDIDMLLASIEAELHGAGGIEKAGLFYVTAAQGIENLTQVFNPMGWNLNGPAVSFSQAVAANESKWKELVTEFAISNSEWFCVGPAKRLIATTIQLIFAVDAANKIAMQQRAPTPASENLQKEADDL